MIAKKLLPTNDCYLQFTSEDLQVLNMKAGDKFSTHIHSDGSVELKKFVPVDIDISDWSWDILAMLVTKSIEEDLPVNEVINNMLRKALDSGELADICSQSSKSEPVLLNEENEQVKIDPNIINNDTSITNQ